MVIAPKAGIPGWTTPSDALLIIKRAASLRATVFAFFFDWSGFNGRRFGRRKCGRIGVECWKTGHPVIGIRTTFQTGTARVRPSITTRPTGLAIRIFGGSLLEPADTVMVVTPETRILRGTAPPDALLVIERAASIIFHFFAVFTWVFDRELWSTGQDVVGIGAALQARAAGVGIGIAFRPPLRARALGGTILQPDNTVLIVAVPACILGRSAPPDTVPIVQGAAAFVVFFFFLFLFGTGVAGHGAKVRQGLPCPKVIVAANCRILSNPIDTAAIGVVSVEEGLVVLTGSIVIHRVFPTHAAGLGAEDVDWSSHPGSHAPVVRIRTDPQTVLFLFQIESKVGIVKALVLVGLFVAAVVADHGTKVSEGDTFVVHSIATVLGVPADPAAILALFVIVSPGQVIDTGGGSCRNSGQCGREKKTENRKTDHDYVDDRVNRCLKNKKL